MNKSTQRFYAFEHHQVRTFQKRTVTPKTKQNTPKKIPKRVNVCVYLCAHPLTHNQLRGNKTAVDNPYTGSKHKHQLIT